MKISTRRNSMSDIFDILRKLENTSNKPKHYVYYDPSNGKVLHIRNYPESDVYPFVELESEELDDESRKLTDFQIVFNGGVPSLIKKIDIAIKFDVNLDIYKIEKINQEADLNIDLIIEQDNINRRFIFVLSNNLFVESLSDDRELIFYVTAENDPNILYQTIRFPVRKLIKTRKLRIFFDGYENKEPCNIYTKKIFETNLHLDKR